MFAVAYLQLFGRKIKLPANKNLTNNVKRTSSKKPSSISVKDERHNERR
jgi:hypothetical protein